MYNTVREKNTSFYYPDTLALLAAKPREFLMRRVRGNRLYSAATSSDAALWCHWRSYVQQACSDACDATSCWAQCVYLVQCRVLLSLRTPCSQRTTSGKQRRTTCCGPRQQTAPLQTWASARSALTWGCPLSTSATTESGATMSVRAHSLRHPACNAVPAAGYHLSQLIAVTPRYQVHVSNLKIYAAQM